MFAYMIVVLGINTVSDVLVAMFSFNECTGYGASKSDVVALITSTLLIIYSIVAIVFGAQGAFLLPLVSTAIHAVLGTILVGVGLHNSWGTLDVPDIVLTFILVLYICANILGIVFAAKLI